MNLKDELKNNEKKIVTDAYIIALEKQDIALDVIDALKIEFAREVSGKFTKEAIADMVFEYVKKIPNEKIQEYINTEQEEKSKQRLSIQKAIIRDINQSGGK